MNKKQSEKVAALNVLITGATGGIGRAIAKLLFQHGANLVLVGRDKEKLAVLKDSLLLNTPKQAAHQDNDVHIIAADLTDETARERLYQQLTTLPFEVNTLINNAGINQLRLFEQANQADLSNIITTNTLAPMLLTQRLLPLLKRQSAAQIINIGSTFGSIGFPGYTAYCTSKFALRGFSQSLSRELDDTNVSVKYLSPRATQTSLNTSEVQAMNNALHTVTDSPEFVANELLLLILQISTERYIGWPERFFVKVNQLFPSIVSKSIVKQLPIIKSFALKC